MPQPTDHPDEAAGPHYTPGRLKLRVLNQEMQLTIPLPAEPSPSEALLPTLRAMSEHFTNLGVAHHEAKGEHVRCSKGCGACCRQLVPIPATEARQLVRFLRSLPPERQQVIRDRVFAGMKKLDEAGVLDKLELLYGTNKEAAQAMAADYFRVGVPCPFLEDEACGIYENRPIVCREYLVVTDPKHCETPWTGETRGVTVPLPMNRMLLRLDDAEGGESWQPMLVLLCDALLNDHDPAPGVSRSAEEWLQRIAKALSRTDADDLTPPSSAPSP